MHPKDALGRHGERLARRYLIDRGLSILATNWRCERGELDIVAAEGDVVVICEVKTRSSQRFGTPAEAVVADKAARLRLLAGRWLAEQTGGWSRVRFDVISVLARDGLPAQLRHLRDVL